MFSLRRLYRRKQEESRLDAEMRFHLDQQTAAHQSAGMDAEQARRLAGVGFGGLEAVKQDCREAHRVNLIETVLQDVRYGMRLLRRNPGFTAVVVLTLALGIGANAAIFSVVRAVLLDPLPYPNADRLVVIWNEYQGKPSDNSGPDYKDRLEQGHTLDSLAALRLRSMNLTGADSVVRIQSASV
ncbi:MAG: permease prefix domain 1-containing protein, partial [Bryobacteraceae bacterium]